MMKTYRAAIVGFAAILFLSAACEAQDVLNPQNVSNPRGVCPVELLASICEQGTACEGNDCVLRAFIVRDCDSNPPIEFQTELACDTTVKACGEPGCLEALRFEAVTVRVGGIGLDPLPYVYAGEDSSAVGIRQGLARSGIAVKSSVKLETSPSVTSFEKLKARLDLPAGNAGEQAVTVNAVVYRLVYEYTPANGGARTIGKIGIAVEVDAQLPDLPGTTVAMRTIRRVPITVNNANVPSFAFDIVDGNRWSYRLYTRKRP